MEFQDRNGIAAEGYSPLLSVLLNFILGKDNIGLIFFTAFLSPFHNGGRRVARSRLLQEVRLTVLSTKLPVVLASTLSKF